MSGIVGLLRLDGAPVDRQLLERLTNFQAFRGPDAQRVWLDGCVGFGHTLLRTTEESQPESQPFSLDGRIWLVADARVDAQSDLREALRARGQHPNPSATDAELILRAYLAWSGDCVEHLLGDFAFAIWDGDRQTLFCARDQMGVKPFYYAQIGSQVIFSNTLDCIRRHPAVSNRLNDLAIADFLLFWHNQNSATTTFADIQRIPPAHCIAWSAAGCRARRYWSMPIDEPLSYRRAEDYCDRFKELLAEAVSDRLRTNSIGIWMSGGLDSTTLAAATWDLLPRRYSNPDLKAFTELDESLPEERMYAQMVADRMGFPIEFRPSGNELMDPQWEQIPFQSPEPHPLAYWVPCDREKVRAAGVGRRVFFHGEGPDNALMDEWTSYYAYLVTGRHYGHLLRAVIPTMLADRRPLFWKRMRRQLGRWSGVGEAPRDRFPRWLSPKLESRLELRHRFLEIVAYRPSTHPTRPNGYDSLTIPLWQVYFERKDAGTTGACVEVRYPFADLRMLRFLLAVPALPWCRSKYLLRRAMRGILPDAVLKRRKVLVPPSVPMRHMNRVGMSRFNPTPELAAFVNPALIPDAVDHDMMTLYGHILVRSLNHWLKYSWKLSHNALSVPVSSV